MKVYYIRLFLISALVFSSILAACQAPQNPPTASPQPSPTQRPLLSPTPTTVWFPPTPTRVVTQIAAVTATPNLKPDIGSLVLDEAFLSIDNWQVFPAINSSVQVSNQRLTMVQGGQNQYATVLHKEIFAYNFYTEVGLQANLCNAADAYGMVVRNYNNEDYYRFEVSCGGVVNIDRVVSSTRFSVIANNKDHFQLTAPPATVRLGIWAKDAEIRFFINDQYLFSITDAVLGSGSIGFFVHSLSGESISVSFTDFKLWALSFE